MISPERSMYAIKKWMTESRPDLKPFIKIVRGPKDQSVLDFEYTRGEWSGLTIVFSANILTKEYMGMNRKVHLTECAYDSLQAVTSYVYPHISIKNIHSRVCYHTGADPTNIHRRDRHRIVCLSRQMTVYLSWKIFAMKKTTIGLIMGQDHATVSHTIRTIKNLITTDPGLKVMMREVLTSLNAEEIIIP